MNEYIKKYANQGIKIFACLPNKSPAVHLGFYAATSNVSELNLQFKNHDDFLIGIPTGNVNKIIVIDIDVGKIIPGSKTEKNPEGIIDPRTREETMADIEENYGPLPDTFKVETMNGGLHLYYKIEYTGLNSRTRFIDNSISCDLRANGGYVIAPDGIKYLVYDDIEEKDVDNLLSRISPLPDWINHIEKNRKIFEYNSFDEETLPPEEIREIRSALAFLNSDDRDTWIKIGMALKSTGSKSSYGLWSEWSQKSEKYNPQDDAKRWKGLKPTDITIATLFHEAQKSGWVTTYETKKEKNTEIPKLITPQKRMEKKPFPEELLHPPGLVGEFIDFINYKSIKYQPILAVGAALSAVGALEGRKIQTSSELRTNIYCLGVGSSGCGKEAARKAIKDIFHYAGCGHMASGEDIASDTAIVNNLSVPGFESQIYLLDEIGLFLKTTSSTLAPAHLSNIVTVLNRLYNTANQMFYGKLYADTKKQVQIDNPNLCIYGTTVPEALYQSLHLNVITNGFLSRMFIFESEETNPKRNRKKNIEKKPPIELIEKIKKIKDKKINHTQLGDLSHFNVYPQIVPLNENAQDLIDDFETYIDNYRAELEKEKRFESIYNRTVQMAMQIALVIAGGVNIDFPVITEQEMSYGISLAKHLSDHMLYISENFIADNDYHHCVKQILQVIRDHGRISLSKLTNKTQHIQPRTRRDILSSLKDGEQIIEKIEGEGKKKRTIFEAL
jgi:hypothetical protein